MAVGIIIGVFVGVAAGFVLAALLTASTETEERNALNAPKTRDNISDGKTSANR